MSESFSDRYFLSSTNEGISFYVLEGLRGALQLIVDKGGENRDALFLPYSLPDSVISLLGSYMESGHSRYACINIMS